MGDAYASRERQLRPVTGCARGETHREVLFTPLTRPSAPDADGVIWTHWGTCPTNGEPILLGDGPPTARARRQVAESGVGIPARSDFPIP